MGQLEKNAEEERRLAANKDTGIVEQVKTNTPRSATKSCRPVFEETSLIATHRRSWGPSGLLALAL